MVPILVAFADANQGTVTHVQRDDALFPLIGRNGTFADDVVIADIVVDTLRSCLKFLAILQRLNFQDGKKF